MSSQNKLTIELVPKTSWYSNVRSNVTTSVWDKIRRECYSKANNVCEICSSTGKSQGFKHNVECHEKWEYNDTNKTQKLIGLIALCPLCHKVKHIGLAQLKGEYDLCLNHLCNVNNLTYNEANSYIKECISIFNRRSQYTWNLDITYLDTYFNQSNKLF